MFIDETWTKTNMEPLRGWAPKGERLVAKVPHGHWQTMTFVAALRHDRIEAPWLIDGPIDGQGFRTYVEKELAPTLKPGDLVIMDNLGSHKGEAVRQAIRSAGAKLFFLPKYSPDLNPDRASVRQVQAPLAQSGGANSRNGPRRHRRAARRLHPRRVRQLPQKRRIRTNLKTSRSSRLLKKSLRLRNEECRRDFLQAGAALVRGFGVTSGRCSVALHVAGRSSPLGAISLGRRTML